MAGITEGSKVWVQPDPRQDHWVAGKLLAEEGQMRRVRIARTRKERVVRLNQIARWSKTRIRTLSRQTRFLKKTLLQAIEQPQFGEWLKRVETGLEVSVPARCYRTRKGRLAMVATLFNHGAIQELSTWTMVGTPEGTMPSWKEMAFIGDALWRSYLRIVFVRRGYRNGEVVQKIDKAKMETRARLKRVGTKLSLESLLPLAQEPIHLGELAEAFLGWAYSFGGEKSYFRLAEKYLAVIEGN